MFVPSNLVESEEPYLTHAAQRHAQGSMHDTGCLGLVHWDDPEGWYGKGGGFRMGNTSCGRFILIFGKTNTIM